MRGITSEPGTVAVVVMPELIFSGPQRLLHNQRALYIKRLLLFEPRVILTSVPYRLSSAGGGLLQLLDGCSGDDAWVRLGPLRGGAPAPDPPARR